MGDVSGTLGSSLIKRIKLWKMYPPKVAFARYDLPYIGEMGVSISRNLPRISEMGSWAHTFRHFQGVAE